MRGPRPSRANLHRSVLGTASEVQYQSGSRAIVLYRNVLRHE